MIRTYMLVGAVAVMLGACSASGGTPIPKTDAEKLTLADEIAALSTDPKMVDGVLDSMGAILMPTMRNMCETIPEQQRSECLAKLEKLQPTMEATLKEGMNDVKKLMPELAKDMGAIMARLYTPEELARMKDYYSSPEGQSILQKQPKVMAEFTPQAIARMQGMQLELMRKVQARVAAALAEEGVKVPPPPPV